MSKKAICINFFGNTPCVISEGKEGFELIFTSTDLDNFDGNIELFF